jgi:hypothetical protein
MRTAVLIFGEVRGDPEHWRDIYEKLVEPNNADVFMHHIYYERGFLRGYSFEQQEALRHYYQNKGLHLTAPQELYDIFKPKSIMLEQKDMNHSLEVFDEIKDRLNPVFYPINTGNYSYDNCKLSFLSQISQQQTRAKVTELKIAYENLHGFKYDNVIMARLDVWLASPIIINTPLTNVFARFWAEDFMLEQIIIGSSELMDCFKDIYPEMLQLYRELCSWDYHYYRNEYFTLKFLHKKEIIPVHYDTPLGTLHDQGGLYRSNTDPQVLSNIV